MKLQSIADIKSDYKKLLNTYKEDELIKHIELFITKYSDDSRVGVQSILSRAHNYIMNYKNEKKRLKNMLVYEEKYRNCLVGGVDEAGRGPLAGPVVAACVILNPDDPIPYVNDSKKLSPDKREVLYEEIIKRSISYGIGIVQEGIIDDINILQATYQAMQIAIKRMERKPQQLLNDAVIIPDIDIPQESIIKGDQKSLNIAAASILAKVSRDRIMVQYDDLYPGYGFVDNKGYGSKAHIEAIKKIGPSAIHRKSFIKNFIG